MSIITKQSSGPLTGYSAMDINQALFAQMEDYCIGRIGYGLGAKCCTLGHFPPHFSLDGHEVALVDCSGFVRMMLWYATDGATKAMPDGSFQEGDWFAQMGFKPIPYTNCGKNDGILRVAVHHPHGRGEDPIGHIWLCVYGHTVESYGHHGPGNRPWDYPVLTKLVDVAFALGPMV